MMQPSDVLYKKTILKHFAVFTGKAPLLESLSSKKTLTKTFSCEYCKILKNICIRLLLKITNCLIVAKLANITFSNINVHQRVVYIYPVKVPLDGTHLVAVRGLIHQEVPIRMCKRQELNWASQLKSSDQQIFSTMSRPQSTLIRQD